MKKKKMKIVPVDSELVERAKKLVEGVEIDLFEPLFKDLSLIDQEAWFVAELSGDVPSERLETLDWRWVNRNVRLEGQTAINFKCMVRNLIKAGRW